MYLGSKREKVRTVEVTPETNVNACFTQPALTNETLGNTCYLAAFLETITPGYSCLKMGAKNRRHSEGTETDWCRVMQLKYFLTIAMLMTQNLVPTEHNYLTATQNQ